jgi:hypothetical protein
MSDPINISSSQYDIQEKMVEVAKNYFNIDDINILKIGLFGYITEIMSLVARDGIFHRDALYNELFLNTANIPKSIYNWAKLYNFNIVNAKPAKMSIYMAIKKEDLINKSILEGLKKVFYIDKNNEFEISGFTFMLENTVKITLNPIAGSNNDYSITANLIIDSKSEKFGLVSSPYVKSWVEKIDEITYCFFILDLYQIQRSENTFSVFSEDLSETIMYDVEYEDQLAGFNVYYNYNNAQEILGKYFDNNFTPSSTEKYCYYTFPQENNLQVYFSGIENSFRPKFNSEILVEYFTTKGSDGNFSFNGEILFKFNDPELSNIQVICDPIGDSVGGENKPSLKEVKSKIIENILIKDNLITENDLNIFFNNISSTVSINSSKLRFMKKRDDVLKRIFSSFVLLKNKNNQVIPTNTVDVLSSLDNLEKFNLSSTSWTIPVGTSIIYDNLTEKYRFLFEDEYPEDYISNDSILLYSTPFLMNIRLEPFPRLTYYQNSLNKIYNFNYKFVNINNLNQYVIPNIEIQRNSFIEDYYTIKFNFGVNVNSEFDINNVKIYGLLKKDLNNLGYIKFDLINNQEYEYSAKIYTEDEFNSRSQLALVNSLLLDLESEDVINKVFIDQGLSMEIKVFYNDELIVSFENEITIDLFRSMNNIVFSDLEISEGGLFNLKSIPLISTKYFNSIENSKEFYNLISNYQDILLSNFDRLENNTGIDFKFFNTYGICKYSSINTVNLTMNFAIKLVNNFSSELDTEIKNYIVNFVETVNDKGGLLSISNIIKELENNFDEIQYIEFKDINGVNQQKIRNLYSDFNAFTTEQLINYVPEHLNISFETTNKPNIQIEYIK